MSRAKEEAFKLYNLRCLPLFAAFLILGIFCALTARWVAMILGIVAILFICALYYTKSILWGLAVALLIGLFFGYGTATLELYLRNEVGLTGQVTVTCRALSAESDDDGVYIVVADEISSGGKRYSGKITFETDTPVSVGDRIRATGEVSITPLSLESVYSAIDYRKGAKYRLTIPAEEGAGGEETFSVERSAGAPPISHTIKSKIRNALVMYEGERAGAFSYAMLFGDADYMLEEDKSAMREVGVAHVFAVSGLHVGLLAGALVFLLRKCKVKDGVSMILILPVFAFYAYLVGFTPSVLRASIMVTIGLAASALGARYDGLSALSLAAILILIVKPLYLFDISFLMSFLSILGIESLSRPIEKTLLGKKVKPKLAAGLALSLATTVSLLPITALVFGRISLVGFALNLVVVPLASLAYVLTLIALPLTLMLSAFGAFFEVIKYLPLTIAEISGRVTEWGLSAKYEFAVAELVLYYGILFFVGKYSLAKRQVKLITAGIGASVLAILIVAG